MPEVHTIRVVTESPRVVKVLGVPGPTGPTGPAGPAGAGTWERSLVIFSTGDLAVGDHSVRAQIPAGITTIGKWTLVAQDEDQALVSTTLTVSLRMSAWASGSWSIPVAGDELSGTQPALSSESSALSSSPGLGALTPGQFLTATISALSGTAPKSLSLTVSAS